MAGIRRRHQQWVRRPAGYRDVRSTGRVQDITGVRRDLVDSGVAGHAGDRAQVDAGMTDREEQGHCVVDTGVHIHDHRDGTGGRGHDRPVDARRAARSSASAAFLAALAFCMWSQRCARMTITGMAIAAGSTHHCQVACSVISVALMKKSSITPTSRMWVVSGTFDLSGFSPLPVSSYCELGADGLVRRGSEEDTWSSVPRPVRLTASGGG